MATSKEAPGDLALVRTFVNTLDVEDDVDELATPGSCTEWLRRHGLLAEGGVSEDERARIVALREALRELLLANNDGHTPGEEAIATLRQAAGQAPLAVDIGTDGAVRLSPVATGVDAALGRILAIVYGAVASGDWSRLKACRNDTCHWAFYDHSRNHSGHWCSMAVCGNRAKVQGYRRRQAGTDQDATD